MEKEIWKEIKGYEGYLISSEGRAMSCRFGRKNIMKYGLSGKPGNQYYSAHLSKNGKVRQVKVHRLVALHFLEKVPGKKYINHKDGNKLNNRKNNVEWCTSGENQEHAYSTGLKTCVHKGKFGKNSHKSKEIHQFTLEGKFIKSWHGAAEINRELGFNPSDITKCCRGLLKRSRGFVWKYTF